MSEAWEAGRVLWYDGKQGYGALITERLGDLLFSMQDGRRFVPGICLPVPIGTAPWLPSKEMRIVFLRDVLSRRRPRALRWGFAADYNAVASKMRHVPLLVRPRITVPKNTGEYVTFERGTVKSFDAHDLVGSVQPDEKEETLPFHVRDCRQIMRKRGEIAFGSKLPFDARRAHAPRKGTRMVFVRDDDGGVWRWTDADSFDKLLAEAASAVTRSESRTHA